MPLKSKKILMLVGDEYEDLELHYPKIRLKEEEAVVLVAGPEENHTYKGRHGYPCRSDASVEDVKADNYDALIIPGGLSPDKLRKIPKVQEITRQFHEQEKLIAFICHAGWIPISAGVIKGVKCTSVDSIKDDLVNAGAIWVTEPVVIDRHFISSRGTDDLPYFSRAIIRFLSNP